ncbi:uncharacterized protein DS421_1g26460 [Arachis hypogaea]|nr:uncharacterized protein DS421_1g26460 [Arachis hypogaea]
MSNFREDMTTGSRGRSSESRGRGRGRIFTEFLGTAQSSPSTLTTPSTPVTFAPNNNAYRQEISEMIKSMYNHTWPSYTKIPTETRERWFQKRALKFIWDTEHNLMIRKIYKHQVAK